MRVQKNVEEVLGNKISNKIAKSKLVSDENSKNVEEITIPPKQKKKTETGILSMINKTQTIA